MTKKESIQLIHKILYVKEDVDNIKKPNITNENLDFCISNCLIRLAGADMEFNLKKKILETLIGMRSLASSLTHSEIRSSVLGLMNDIDRSE